MNIYKNKITGKLFTITQNIKPCMCGGSIIAESYNRLPKEQVHLKEKTFKEDYEIVGER